MIHPGGQLVTDPQNPAPQHWYQISTDSWKEIYQSKNIDARKIDLFIFQRDRAQSSYCVPESPSFSPGCPARTPARRSQVKMLNPKITSNL